MRTYVYIYRLSLIPPDPHTIELAAKAPQMSRIQEKNTVVVRPARDISTAMIPTSPSEKTELGTQPQTTTRPTTPSSP
jgi:hypothetical protein